MDTDMNLCQFFDTLSMKISEDFSETLKNRFCEEEIAGYATTLSCAGNNDPGTYTLLWSAVLHIWL